MAVPKGFAPPNKTSQDILDAIVALYISGHTAKQAAAAFGKTEYVCLDELKRQGISARKSLPPVGLRKSNQETLDAIVALYQDGQTAEQAAKAFGKDQSVCLDELKRRGIPRRRAGIPKGSRTKKATSQALLDAAVQGYLAGKSADEAAAAVGISGTVCLRALKARGIARREMKGAEWGRKISANRQGVSLDQWHGYASEKWGLVRATPEYVGWRISVFKRDDYRCADCGKRHGKLQAHHIFPKARFPQLLIEIQNGITLCKDCHRAIKGKEMDAAPRYLSLIGSTVAPLVWCKERHR